MDAAGHPVTDVLDRVAAWLTRAVDRVLFGRPADPPPAWTQRRYRRLVEAGAVIGIHPDDLEDEQ